MSAARINMSSGVCLGLRVAYRCFNSARSRSGVGVQTRAFCSSAREQFSPAVESTEEYKYVERLIPPTRVPPPPKHTGPTPSGWVPPPALPPALPYMVRRSRMHNVPVYTDITHGNRKTTVLRKIEGDIWALEKDVKAHLACLTGKSPPTQVNEVTRSIRVKGHFDEELKSWLVEKGF
ncbi:large ribosomal subunit protein mL49 [Lepisosteus oculatus]|uniref:large ribosomal subunit protein mL49 n=1 Tax=Lepisosteus oculatus TaxID=7918 RepID=UPI0035F519AF